MTPAVPIRRARHDPAPSVPPACYIGVSYRDWMQSSSASDVVRLLLSLTPHQAAPSPAHLARNEARTVARLWIGAAAGAR
jgi:hypothetical protein